MHLISQILENVSGKSLLDCLSFFRQEMGKESAEDLLSMAIDNFPKCSILVSFPLCCEHCTRALCSAKYSPTWAWDLVCEIFNTRWRQLGDSDKVIAEVVSCLLRVLHPLIVRASNRGSWQPRYVNYTQREQRIPYQCANTRPNQTPGVCGLTVL